MFSRVPVTPVPNFEKSSACNAIRPYTRLPGRPATAAPICYDLPGKARAVVVRVCGGMYSGNAWRPLPLRGGPPNLSLSLGSRQLLRALMSLCITKRGSEFPPDSPLVPARGLWTKVKAHTCAHIHAADLHRYFVLLACVTRPSLWRVQDRSSNRHSEVD